MLEFKHRIFKLVKAVPIGFVSSYGEIAVCAGYPRGARQVGWVLNGLTDKEISEIEIPWWRIVSKEGFITISFHEDIMSPALIQRDLLKAENIPFKEEFRVDISICRYIFLPNQCY